jgi:hypothetical protein
MRRAVTIVVTLAALVAAPAAAEAACGGVKAAGSERNLAKGPEPIAIGDSVMLLAVKPLARAGFNTNARGCRQWSEGHRILRRKKRMGRLPRLVVMALGTNWYITRDEIGRTRRMLGRKRVLAIVTPRDPGGSGDAKRIRAAGRAHPRRINVIDWVRFSRGHGNWFGGDGIHLTYTGVENYVRCLKRSLRFANGPRAAASARRHPCA